MYRVNSEPLVDGASGNATHIPVASTGTKYTQAFKVAYAKDFSVSYILASSGTPDVQIDIEESVDGKPPVSEGASSSNFIIPSQLSTPIQADLTTKTWNLTGIQPLISGWMRFKLTGKNANPSDTTFDGYVHLQEQID